MVNLSKTFAGMLACLAWTEGNETNRCSAAGGGGQIGAQDDARPFWKEPHLETLMVESPAFYLAYSQG